MSRVIAAVDRVTTSQFVIGMARAVAEALDVSLEIRYLEELTHDGDPVRALASASEEEDVVAIVLGARSTSDDAARHLSIALADLIDKPVLMVPPGFLPPEQLHAVVVAMEGTPGKARVLKRSIALSARAGLEIVVVHVDEEDSVPSFSDQVQYETEAYAQEFFARHLVGAPQMRLELRVGDPASEVLDAIDSAGAELVAVGWPQDPSRGAVARRIVDRSPVPVLMIPIV